MKQITTSIQAYPFDELNEDAQNNVMNDWINAEIESVPVDSDYCLPSYKKAYDECEKMRTPWFFGEYVYDYCKDEIIEVIELNEYLFDCDGEMLPIMHYTEGNKTVKVTIKLHGSEIDISDQFNLQS